MQELLDSLSGLSTFVIAGAFAVHLAFFFLLWVWSRRDLRNIASSLYQFTSNLRHRSVMDSTVHLSDQIEAFLADVNEVLENPARRTDREALLHRMNILDENRRYLNSLLFETCYNLCRTMIEAYPLAGVLGTILAIGAALNSPLDPETASSVGAIVQRFGEAIWSTFAGSGLGDCFDVRQRLSGTLLQPAFGKPPARPRDRRPHQTRTVDRTGGR
jgi:biopolymer transport protein ExbB